MNVEQFLQQADRICRERGARFTDLRRRVLQLIAESDQPLGAYALLDLLKEDDQKADRKAAPPTVYRALDFLLQHGLIHRIASHNTYIVCDHPGHRHAGLFLVCSQCGAVDECDNHQVSDAVREVAGAQQFFIQEENMEVIGLCYNCQQAGER